MCCSGVKCSAVPSSSPLHTHSCQRGEGQKTGEQGEGGNERGREGHWCSCSSHREEKFYIVHDHTSRNINISLTECPIPHSLVHFFLFFSFLSCSFLSITDSLGSDPHTHWDEGGNYCANMRIFCILLNFPTQNYTLYPRFCLIIHLLHLLKSFGKVMWSGKLSCEKKTRAVWWLLSQLKVRNRTLIHFFCFVPTVQNL